MSTNKLSESRQTMEISGELGMVETKNKNREKRGKSLENKNIWAHKKKGVSKHMRKKSSNRKTEAVAARRK